MRATWTAITAAALAGLLLAGACKATEPASPRREPAGTPPTQVSSGVLPTTGPAAKLPKGSTQYTKGEATLKVSGQVDANLTLPIAPGSLLTTGGMALSYVDEAGNFFGFGGVSFDGTKETSATLSLTITTMKPATAFFVSVGGECLITLDQANSKGASGSFTCRKLRSSGSTVNASGTFVAAV